MKSSTSRPSVLNHAVSPLGLSLFSTGIFLFAWLLPSATYSSIIDEPDYMHLSAVTLLFFLLCVSGFLFGALLFDLLFPSPTLLDSRKPEPNVAGFYLILPLLISSLLTLIEAYKYYEALPNMLVLLISQQGNAIKNDLQDSGVGIIQLADSCHMAVLWWTYWRISNASKTPRWRPTYIAAFVIAILADIIVSIVKVSRGGMMPMIGGLALLFILGKLRRHEMNSRRLMTLSFRLGIGIVSFFFLFSILRGTNDVSELTSQVSGYTIASYNRMAALLLGKMHYPYGGHGVYLASFFYNAKVNDVIPIKDILGWPDSHELWGSEFQAVQIAGLNPFLIWSGTFGYLFADFGWGTPLVLMIYGLLYGLVWRQAKSAAAFGIVLYPWFGFCILTWFGPNLLMAQEISIFLIMAFLLTMYEKLLSPRLQLAGRATRSQN